MKNYFLCIAISFGITGPISADWSDWFTPKTIVATGYASACIFGCFILYRPYKKEVADLRLPLNEAWVFVRNEYEENVNAFETEFINAQREKFGVTSHIGPEKKGSNDYATNYDGCNCSNPITSYLLKTLRTSFDYEKKYTYGKGDLHRSIFKYDKIKDRPVYDRLTINATVYPRPWLQGVAGAYVFAGLGVLAYCGLGK